MAPPASSAVSYADMCVEVAASMTAQTAGLLGGDVGAAMLDAVVRGMSQGELARAHANLTTNEEE